MTKANDNRVRQSLERTRLKLKAESLEMEQRRREFGTERRAAVTFLRVLCERYGDNDWPEELPLVEILRDHLAQPLHQRVQVTLARLAEAEAAVKTQAAPEAAPEPATVVRARSEPTRPPQRAIAPQAPRPAPPRPRLVEEVRHSVITVQVQERGTGRVGWKASCVCTWFSGIETHRIAATQAGGAHVATMRNPQHRQGVAHHA